MKTKQDVINAGGILVNKSGGATWNDGGSWNTWIFYIENDARYIRVHQPTDYRSEVEIEDVVPKVETKVVYHPLSQ